MATRSTRIAIVGAGPTAVYTLKNLLQKPGRFNITVFEAGPVAGCGIPYSESHNTQDMMANITSVEIPPVLTSLADWVRSASPQLLRRFGIDRDAVGDRDFYPRVLIGAYYVDQLQRLVAAGEVSGHAISVSTDTRVLDIKPDSTGFTLFLSTVRGKARQRSEAVIMATGHLTDLEKPARQGGLYRSPYPAQELKVGPDRAALVIGSSLSAIDAVVALATRYGSFNDAGGSLAYVPKSSKPLRLVMASRKGLVPDADFFYPVPEEPLMIFTSARLHALQKEGKTGFLAKAVKLFKQQLAADDPAFVSRLSLKRFTPQSFATAYFKLRQTRQGFDAVADNLREAQRDYGCRRVVMWRYTLMRAHEVFSEFVPFLDRQDLKRFHQHLTPIFADAYGCVPHISIQRLLALHRAGCLDLLQLGDTGSIRYSAGQFRLEGLEGVQTFETLIDARGQEMTSIAELGFSRLDQALETKDFLRRSGTDADTDQFRVPLGERLNPNIFCISIPVMMKRYPFAQGLVACSEAAEIVANAA
jgi:uncharacterized NAD(P)/FAD-binding protein YdhS